MRKVGYWTYLPFQSSLSLIYFKKHIKDNILLFHPLFFSINVFSQYSFLNNSQIIKLLLKSLHLNLWVYIIQYQLFTTFFLFQTLSIQNSPKLPYFLFSFLTVTISQIFYSNLCVSYLQKSSLQRQFYIKFSKIITKFFKLFRQILLQMK